MGGRIVRHARQIVFQLAEVAVPRELFAIILEQVSQLRLAPGKHTEVRSNSQLVDSLTARFVYLCWTLLFLTAMATARLLPTSTTNRLARVITV